MNTTTTTTTQLKSGEASASSTFHLFKPSALNEHFQCGICQGYIIDATTIADCLHSCKYPTTAYYQAHFCIIRFVMNGMKCVYFVVSLQVVHSAVHRGNRPPLSDVQQRARRSGDVHSRGQLAAAAHLSPGAEPARERARATRFVRSGSDDACRRHTLSERLPAAAPNRLDHSPQHSTHRRCSRCCSVHQTFGEQKQHNK